MSRGESKVCARCGRRFEWRRRWADCWDRVRYCSGACRRQRTSRVDRRLEVAIVELLEARRGGSICPSEAARAVRPSDWRPLMERARRAARRLAAEGRIEITQRDRVVDPSEFRGPIRVRLGRAG